MDVASRDRVSVEARTLYLDLFSWLDLIDVVRNLCGEYCAQPTCLIQAARSVGRIILRLCLALDLVRRLGDGNAFTWIYHLCSFIDASKWIASLFSLGFSRSPKYLDSP